MAEINHQHYHKKIETFTYYRLGLTYNSSIGRKRTKKHVELGLCIKRITGFVDAVRWLNRFGHSISHDEINALETKLAEEQVNNQTNTSLVPTHIQPIDSNDDKLFTVFENSSFKMGRDSFSSKWLTSSHPGIIQIFNYLYEKGIQVSCIFSIFCKSFITFYETNFF